MRRTAQRTSTTVVALVGDGARACAELLGRGANVTQFLAAYRARLRYVSSARMA